MDKEPQEYEEKAQEVTQAPGEGAGGEQDTGSETTETDQSTRADK